MIHYPLTIFKSSTGPSWIRSETDYMEMPPDSMSHVGALMLQCSMLSSMVIIRRWRLPRMCITVRTLSIQSETLAQTANNLCSDTDGDQRSMQAWLLDDHLCCYIIQMSTKNLSTFDQDWSMFRIVDNKSKKIHFSKAIGLLLLDPCLAWPQCNDINWPATRGLL